jgi:hypothetical protein
MAKGKIAPRLNATRCRKCGQFISRKEFEKGEIHSEKETYEDSDSGETLEETVHFHNDCIGKLRPIK